MLTEKLCPNRARTSFSFLNASHANPKTDLYTYFDEFPDVEHNLPFKIKVQVKDPPPKTSKPSFNRTVRLHARSFLKPFDTNKLNLTLQSPACASSTGIKRKKQKRSFAATPTQNHRPSQIAVKENLEEKIAVRGVNTKLPKRLNEFLEIARRANAVRPVLDTISLKRDIMAVWNKGMAKAIALESSLHIKRQREKEERRAITGCTMYQKAAVYRKALKKATLDKDQEKAKREGNSVISIHKLPISHKVNFC